MADWDLKLFIVIVVVFIIRLQFPGFRGKLVSTFNTVKHKLPQHITIGDLYITLYEVENEKETDQFSNNKENNGNDAS